MRVFVTGASGFIGHALCARLLERGHEVAALVRRSGSEPAGTDPVAGALGDGSDLGAAIVKVGPDCVVHLAAEIASQRSARKINEVNVAGTRRLLDACAAAAGGEPAGGPRVVFSSTVVTGDARGALLTEETPLPVRTAYGRSKLAGERLVLESGLPAVVIRPSHVYGPGGWYASELIAHLRQPGRFAVIGPRREPVGRGARRRCRHCADACRRGVCHRRGLPRRRRRADHVLRVHGADVSCARDRCATADTRGAGERDRGARGGRSGRALGALVERQDQGGARLASSLSVRARGRPGCRRAPAGTSLGQRVELGAPRGRQSRVRGRSEVGHGGLRQ